MTQTVDTKLYQDAHDVVRQIVIEQYQNKLNSATKFIRTVTFSGDIESKYPSNFLDIFKEKLKEILEENDFNLTTFTVISPCEIRFIFSEV